MWSVNGIKFADAEPLQFKYGERIRINLINDTMMNHPIHLHGMWSDLETGERTESAMEPGDLVVIQPGVAHAFRVMQEGVAIEFAPTRFDPADIHQHPLT